KAQVKAENKRVLSRSTSPQRMLSFSPLPLRPCDEFSCRFTHLFRNGQAAQHAGNFLFSPDPLERSDRGGRPLPLQPLFYQQMMFCLGGDLRKVSDAKDLMERSELA